MPYASRPTLPSLSSRGQVDERPDICPHSAAVRVLSSSAADAMYLPLCQACNRSAHLRLAHAQSPPTPFLTLHPCVSVAGIPCSAALGGGWFKSHPSWWCSPAVIAAFNYGDWVGRLLPTLQKQAALTPPHVYALAASRLILVPAIVLLSASGAATVLGAAQPPMLLGMVCLVAVSNGYVGTFCMMRAPALVAARDREACSRLMVLALYVGIACGSIVAGALSQTMSELEP